MIKDNKNINSIELNKYDLFNITNFYESIICNNYNFKDANDRIGQDKYPSTLSGKSNLLGAFFIDYALYDNRHVEKHPTRILEPSIVKKLYNIAEKAHVFVRNDSQEDE